MHAGFLRRSRNDHDIARVRASMQQILRRIEQCDLDMVAAFAAGGDDRVDSAGFELHRNNCRLLLGDPVDQAVADALKARSGEMLYLLLELLLQARWTR
jgi:hypothetical protein